MISVGRRAAIGPVRGATRTARDAGMCPCRTAARNGDQESVFSMGIFRVATGPDLGVEMGDS